MLAVRSEELEEQNTLQTIYQTESGSDDCVMTVVGWRSRNWNAEASYEREA